MSDHILDALYNVLLTRKSADPENSYVASLYAGGSQKISAKIEEEAQETIEESLRLEKSSKDDIIRKALIHETADLFFHVSVLLAHHEINPEEVFSELASRFGTSGHEEKANRKH